MSERPCVAVVGGGPAGLMAAEVLAVNGASLGLQVHVFDAMPSVGRKFLLAGRGGLNLTHAEPAALFNTRFGTRNAEVTALLQDFGAQQMQAWAHGLGVETFVGTSQRVFPKDMKAAPLLRAWLHRLRQAGVVFHARHRFTGWSSNGALQFESPHGATEFIADCAILALGGASWSRLGSDGAWVAPLQARGVSIAPLAPSNCGFDVAVHSVAGLRAGWSDFLCNKFAGQPVKPVALHFTDSMGQSVVRQGEFVLTDTGIEGSLVYAASALLRDEIARSGSATLHLDLLPTKTLEQVQTEVTHPRGSRSLSSHLESRLNLHGLKVALLHELLPKATMGNTVALATAIKALPLTVTATRPIDEAISTAGGVRFEAMNTQLMLSDMPGVFCAGEMLDWEAPTGGYLLTASMASGRAAGQGALDWLASRR